MSRRNRPPKPARPESNAPAWLALGGVALVFGGIIAMAVWPRKSTKAPPNAQTSAVARPVAKPPPPPQPSGPQFPPPPPNEKPDDQAMRLLNEGAQLFEGGFLTNAIERYVAALKIKPEEEDAHYNLAIAYARAGRTNDAIRHYEETLKIVPDYNEARNNLGNLLTRLGRFADADKLFRNSIENNPDDAGAHNNLGTLLAQQKKPAEALEQFREAARLDPAYLEARLNLGYGLLNADKPSEAIPEFEAAVKLILEKTTPTPPSFSARAQKGLALARARQSVLEAGPPPK